MKIRKTIPLLAIGACLALLPSTTIAKGGPPRPALCAPLKSYDTDADGTVSAEELATASAAEVTKVQTAFLTKYDLDIDGTVTTVEAQTVFGFISTDWLECVLDHFDKNGDGAISSAEVAAVEGDHKGPRGGRR